MLIYKLESSNYIHIDKNILVHKYYNLYKEGKFSLIRNELMLLLVICNQNFKIKT